MDEYVKIKFPTKRKVYVDGSPAGLTNRIFQVETGHHTFKLGPKKNYRPEKRERKVKDTLPTKPMIISFERIEKEMVMGFVGNVRFRFLSRVSGL